MKICLASIHPRMLSGQIESLIALRDGLEALGHTVTVVSAFAVRYAFDTTNKKTGQRSQDSEIAVYTVKGGKIVQEQFFSQLRSR